MSGSIAAQQFEQRDIELAFHQDFYHALRGAAQREGIARAGGDHADAETAAQRVQLVGEGNHLARVRLRGIESSMLSGL